MGENKILLKSISFGNFFTTSEEAGYYADFLQVYGSYDDKISHAFLILSGKGTVLLNRLLFGKLFAAQNFSTDPAAMATSKGGKGTS